MDWWRHDKRRHTKCWCVEDDFKDNEDRFGGSNRRSSGVAAPMKQMFGYTFFMGSYLCGQNAFILDFWFYLGLHTDVLNRQFEVLFVDIVNDWRHHVAWSMFMMIILFSIKIYLRTVWRYLWINIMLMNMDRMLMWRWLLVYDDMSMVTQVYCIVNAI